MEQVTALYALKSSYIVSNVFYFITDLPVILLILMQKGIPKPRPEEYTIGAKLSDYMVNALYHSYGMIGDDLELR